jgi:hypothetical protein
LNEFIRRYVHAEFSFQGSFILIVLIVVSYILTQEAGNIHTRINQCVDVAAFGTKPSTLYEQTHFIDSGNKNNRSVCQRKTDSRVIAVRKIESIPGHQNYRITGLHGAHYFTC